MRSIHARHCTFRERPVQHHSRNRYHMASDKFLQLHRCAASGDAVGTANILCRFGRAPDELAAIAAALTTAAASSSAGHTEVIRVLLEDGRADPTPLRGWICTPVFEQQLQDGKACRYARHA